MIQIAGKPEIMEIINKIIMGIDVRQASQRQQFKLLQMHAPVIASFISKLVITAEIPPDVHELFRQLKDLCLAPFVTPKWQNFSHHQKMMIFYLAFLVCLQFEVQGTMLQIRSP